MNTCARFECSRYIQLGSGYMQCCETNRVFYSTACKTCEIRRDNSLECSYCKKFPCHKKPSYIIYD